MNVDMPTRLGDQSKRFGLQCSCLILTIQLNIKVYVRKRFGRTSNYPNYLAPTDNIV